MKNPTITITISPDLLRRVAEMAIKEERSISAQVRVLLKRAMKKEEGK